MQKRLKLFGLGFFLAVALLLAMPAGMTHAAPGATVYTVQPGDTLFDIARTYGTTIDQLMQANGLGSDMIYPGQTLKVGSANTPQGAVKAASQSSGMPAEYTVQPGDSLYKIAKRFGVKLDDLISANGLTTDVIYVGQVLTLPAGKGGQTPATPVVSQPQGEVSRGSRYTDEELNLLAHLIYAEARGESYLGQLAVGAVVMNRVKAPGFPKTIKGVIFEPWAFTAVDDGQFYLTPDANAIQAAKDALAGKDPTGGALYYYNPDTARSAWIFSRPVVARIGHHNFAK